MGPRTIPIMMLYVQIRQRGEMVTLNPNFFIDIGLLPQEACATPPGKEGGPTQVGSLPVARPTNEPVRPSAMVMEHIGYLLCVLSVQCHVLGPNIPSGC
jgi:hypothetical protein